MAIDAAVLPDPGTSNILSFPTAYTSSGDNPWAYTAPVSRADALAVPACSRSLDLLASTMAGLPIEEFDTSGRPVESSWVEGPFTGLTRWTVFNLIGRDLILHGVAWMIRDLRDGESYSYAAASTVTVTYQPDPVDPWTYVTTITVNGQPLPDGVTALQIPGWHDGILNHGARLLRTALALDGAAKRMADTPVPSVTLRNESNYELSTAEIAELLAAYKASRSSSAIGYLNAGISENINGWNSVEQQLVEARQFTNGQVANLMGVPGHMIAGGTGSSSSLTYANVTQENRAFLDFGLNPLIKSVEAAFTSWVRPGHHVRFNLGAMLRGNPAEIATIIAQLSPLGLITPAEARIWIDLVPGGPTA